MCADSCTDDASPGRGASLRHSNNGRSECQDRTGRCEALLEEEFLAKVISEILEAPGWTRAQAQSAFTG